MSSQTPKDPQTAWLESAKASVSSRKGLVEVITAPLGFFVLALLIVEGFLGAALFSKLPDEQKIYCVFIGAAMFLLVVGAVVWLVAKHPRHLTFDKDSHLASQKIGAELSVGNAGPETITEVLAALSAALAAAEDAEDLEESEPARETEPVQSR